MIQRMSHSTVWVLDQERALTFYTEKLGFEIRHDETLEGFRWLTVGPKGQPDHEIILVPIKASPMMGEDVAATIRDLVKKGALGPGVLATGDCQKTYEELSARGVQFVSPPAERPYGVEALLLDDSGNWFSLVQPRRR